MQELLLKTEDNPANRRFFDKLNVGYVSKKKQSGYWLSSCFTGEFSEAQLQLWRTELPSSGGPRLEISVLAREPVVGLEIPLSWLDLARANLAKLMLRFSTTVDGIAYDESKADLYLSRVEGQPLRSIVLFQYLPDAGAAKIHARWATALTAEDCELPMGEVIDKGWLPVPSPQELAIGFIDFTSYFYGVLLSEYDLNVLGPGEVSRVTLRVTVVSL